MSQHSPRLILGEPIVIAQGPAQVRRWGPWQFPSIERLAGGGLHVTYHLEADDYTAYGLPKGHAVSHDNGRAWQAVAGEPPGGGLTLANGDRLRTVTLRSRPLAELTLPQPIGTLVGSYGNTPFAIYLLEDLPDELRAGWRFERCLAGQTGWRAETAIMHIPGEVRWAGGSVFTFPWVWRMRLAPDGALWGLNYGFHSIGGKMAEKWMPLLLRSVDHGHTWELHSTIPYQPDPAADPLCAKREGFSENNLTFLADGSLLCFMRTTDGHGVGPMYVCRSGDGGRTWDRPVVFDDEGVWPATVELPNGVALVSYGRPGLFVRASGDPAGRVWGDRVAVVEPRALQTDTCSYSDLVVLDERTAMIAYSHFNYPGPDGLSHKTILVRTITAEV